MGKTKQFFCAALLVSICQPISADVLILIDGEHVRTRGPWQVRGRVVVFTTLDGTLSSVRTGGVDLAASRQATENLGLAPQPPSSSPASAVAPARPARKPVMVLTNADLRSSAPVARLSDGRDEESLAPTAAKGESRLVVDSWAEIEDTVAGSLEVIGKLINRGSASERVTGIVVELRAATGRDGMKVKTSPEDVVVSPGSSTSFRAKFYGVSRDHGRPNFEVDSVREAENASVNMAAASGQ